LSKGFYIAYLDEEGSPTTFGYIADIFLWQLIFRAIPDKSEIHHLPIYGLYNFLPVLGGIFYNIYRSGYPSLISRFRTNYRRIFDMRRPLSAFALLAISDL